MASLKSFIFGRKAVPYIDVISEETREGINKAYIPKFLFKPPYGFPRFANIEYIRYLAKTPYVEMCIDTILKEISSLDWDIVPNPEVPERVGDDLYYEEDGSFKEEVESEINHIKNFLQNPNTNKECFEDVFVKMAYRDVLEVNTGVINKVYNLKQEMVEIVARDGCLPYNSYIDTDKGVFRIGEIVKNKMDVRVKSVNLESNEIEYKPVTNWFTNGTTSDWLKLYSISNSKHRNLTCTPNHKIYTKDGYKLAGDLKVGDVLYTTKQKLSDDEVQLLLGSLLGDASLNKRQRVSFSETHSIKQKEYLLYKKDSLDRFNPVYDEYYSRYDEAHKETLKCRIRTEANNSFNKFKDLKYPEFKKEIFDLLELRGLAIWIQDDGYFSPYGSIDISTHCFKKEVLEYAQRILKDKFGYESKIRKDNRFSDSWILYFNKETTTKLIVDIKDFVHPSMSYKIGKSPEEVGKNMNIKEGSGFELEESELKIIQKLEKYDSKYDIEVKDNHNYFAHGKLISNSTFTKNPDIHGMMTNRKDILLPKKIVESEGEVMNHLLQIPSGYAREQAAYFQYGWITGPVPIPFGKKEIVWIQNMLRSDDIYGFSPVQLLAKALQMLIYHIESDLEYYNDNNVPKGVIGIDASDSDEIKNFKDQWYDSQRTKDEFGNWKKSQHKVPILNYIPKFERIEFSSEEIQLIEKQKWYSKMVWACYDEQTEILTDNGWKYFKDLKDEKVARVNPYDLKTDFVLPIDKQVYDFDGDLFHYKHCNIDLMVTPDHKMLFKSQRDFEEDSKLDWKTCLAKDEKTMYVPQSVDFDGENIDEMSFTSENKYVSNEHKETEKFSISGDDFVSFMGFWLGDGWVESDNNRIVLCASSVYPENIDFIESLLKRMGVDYKLKVSKSNGVIKGKEFNVNGEMYYFRFSNKAFRDYLLQFKKSHDKFIPDVIKNCSSNQKKLFFNSYLFYYGCEYYESGRNTTFFSMSKRLIDDLQEMLVKDSQSCNINEQSGGYNLTLRKKQYCLIDKKVHINKVKYVGKVYDVTVPDHHFLLVRRNGRVVVSGNCFGVTSTELGYTEDGSGVSNQIVQSKVFKKKAINPAVRMISGHINREIIPEFEYEVSVKIGKKELPMPKYVFKFKTFDIDEEKQKAELHKLWIDSGRKTINEIRIEEGDVPVDWGDGGPNGLGSNPSEMVGAGDVDENADFDDFDFDSEEPMDVGKNSDRSETRTSNMKSLKKNDSEFIKELKHKYKKRVRKGDKWVYTYDDDKVDVVAKEETEDVVGSVIDTETFKEYVVGIVMELRNKFKTFAFSSGAVEGFLKEFLQLKHGVKTGGKTGAGGKPSSGGKTGVGKDKKKSKLQQLFDKYGLGDLTNEQKKALVNAGNEMYSDLVTNADNSDTTGESSLSESFDKYSGDIKLSEMMGNRDFVSFRRDFIEANLENDENRYTKFANLVLDKYGNELKTMIPKMLTVFDGSTTFEERDFSRFMSQLLYDIGGRVSRSAEPEISLKLFNILDKNVIETNKALKYMGYKQRVKKDGLRKPAVASNPEDVIKAMKKGVISDIKYNLGPNYVKGSGFKNEAELMESLKNAIDRLPASSKKYINDGGTELNFVTRNEIKALRDGNYSSSRASGYYLPSNNQIYIFPPKTTESWKFAPDKFPTSLTDEGYSEDMFKLGWRKSWEHTVTHELAHAVSLNPDASGKRVQESGFGGKIGELQQEYNDFYYNLSPEDRFSRVSGYAGTNTKEDFAESFAFYGLYKKDIDKVIDKEPPVSWLNEGVKKRLSWMREKIW